mmetsp:Transcript_16472/g.40233  ORF Transcript_16472/g.40233 Transcript_16472/m.40233 type:complete len:186 (+) Transcript_16472:727-1284(+)
MSSFRQMFGLPGFVNNPTSSSSEQYPFESEQRGHIYGCSLAYQVHDLMRPNGYEIVYLDGNNAVFYDKQTDAPAGLKDYTPLSLTDLYNRGYWNMPDQAVAYSFNREIEKWQKFKADEMFSHLLSNSKAKALYPHGHHHVAIGDLVNDGKGPQPPLRHGCFNHMTGALKDAQVSPKSCSWSVIPS